MASDVIRRDVLVGAAACAGALAFSGTNGFATSPRNHDITITSFQFEPKHIVVKVGDMIRWTNADLAPHTATAMDASWDTGEIVKDASQSVTVTEGMESSYFCAFHPHMKGTIELD